MQISELPLPPEVRDFYLKQGIIDLYPPQEEAVWAGVLDGANLLAAVPTASGKTMIAELAMLCGIKRGGKALYIVPLRALASEKYEHFKKFEELGISTGISTGDFESRDEWLSDRDIIVATSEKVDSLLRNGASWMGDITVVVADEIHLIDSANRGPTLEVVLAKLKSNSKMQILGLSATIGNPRDIADWLDARLVTSDWRPVELREGVFFGSAINYSDSTQKKIEQTDRDDTVNLVLDTLGEGGQCLVFESSRKNAEASAKRISKAIKKTLTAELLLELRQAAVAIRNTSDTDTTRTLATCIEGGASFHHAGLSSEQRSIVERAYRQGILKVMSSTPTLAAGLNLPARRVIIRGYKRYDPNYGSIPIPVLEYKQMAGRAGRPRLDPCGEAIAITKSYEEAEWVKDNYLNGEPEDIWSKLASEPALRTHILSLIATKFAQTTDEVVGFISKTFYAHQRELWEIKSTLKKILVFLENNEMITEYNDELYPTDLGILISKLYLDPLSASIIINHLAKKPGTTDLTLLQIVCKTPDMKKLYLRKNDYAWLEDFTQTYQSELIPPDCDYEWYLSEIKTATLIHEWINEVPEKDICTKYNIGEGDIKNMSETAQWLTHAASRISRSLEQPQAKQLAQLTQRITHGASTELLPLIQIRNIGRVRARKLYNAGYHTTAQIKNTPTAKLAKIIGEKTAENITRQLHEKNNNDDDYDTSGTEPSGTQDKQKTLTDY